MTDRELLETILREVRAIKERLERPTFGKSPWPTYDPGHFPGSSSPRINKEDQDAIRAQHDPEFRRKWERPR